MKCYVCQLEAETRPYGKGCAPVCFDCAFSTPEIEKQTKDNFGSQFEAAAKTGVVVIGEEVGPYPGENHPGLLDALASL